VKKNLKKFQTSNTKSLFSSVLQFKINTRTHTYFEINSRKFKSKSTHIVYIKRTVSLIIVNRYDYLESLINIVKEKSKQKKNTFE
jgi:hypothetical protein